MAYFQYLRGENEGQIVTLNYIDNSDPFLTLYVFSDDFKCNKEFIGALNDKEAYNKGCILAQISNVNNKWKLNKKEIKPEEPLGITKDGQKVTAADPYFFDKNGGVLHQSSVNINAIPPYPDFNATAFDESKFYLVKEDNLDNNIIDESVNEQVPEQAISQEIVKDASTIEETSPADFIKKEQVSNQIIVKKPLEAKSSNPTIELLLKDCNKESYGIDMELDVQLPAKTLFEIISKNYPESYVDDMLDYIIKDIDTETIKNAMKESILSFYKDEEISYDYENQ